jgi:hypothetical protein
VAIIHRKMQKKTWWSSSGKFSQIWLLARYEIQHFNHPSISLATHWKPNTNIISFFISLPAGGGGDWKNLQNQFIFEFSMLNFYFWRDLATENKQAGSNPPERKNWKKNKTIFFFQDFGLLQLTVGSDRGKRSGNRASCEAVNDLIQQEEVCGYGDLRTTAGVPYSLVFLGRFLCSSVSSGDRKPRHLMEESIWNRLMWISLDLGPILARFCFSQAPSLVLCESVVDCLVLEVRSASERGEQNGGVYRSCKGPGKWKLPMDSLFPSKNRRFSLEGLFCIWRLSSGFERLGNYFRISFFHSMVFELWFIGCIVFVSGDNLTLKTHRISSTVVVRILWDCGNGEKWGNLWWSLCDFVLKVSFKRYNSIVCNAYPRLEARGCMSGGRFARLDDLELIESRIWFPGKKAVECWGE